MCDSQVATTEYILVEIQVTMLTHPVQPNSTGHFEAERVGIAVPTDKVSKNAPSVT